MAKSSDFNRRFVAAFLALVFAISCLVVGFSFAGNAEDVDGFNMETKTENGLTLSKGLKSNGNGTYDIRLEAYSTGTTKKYNEQIPTDYVLIADQSGSMSTNDVPTGYDNGTTKNWKVSDGANAYYYKETDSDGVDHYYRVYRKYGDMFQYHARDTVYSGSCVANLSWFQSESDQDLGKASQYFYNPSLDNSGSRVGSATDNRFYPVNVSAKGGVGYYGIRFRFTDVNGTSDYLRYPDQPYYKSPTGGLFGPGDRWGLLFRYDTCNWTCKSLTGNDSTQYTYGSFLGVNTGMYVRQVLFSRHNDYSQLAYRDDDGVEHLLIDATYCNSNGTPVGGSCGTDGVPSGDYTSTTEAYWNGTLYSASGTTTRLNALKAAMTEFIGVVSTQQNEDGTQPDHRVAIVGFTSLSGTGSANTELLTGINLNTSASNKTGVRYNNITSQQYKEALLDVTNAEQLAKLNNAVQALDASGGTEGQYGLYMAKNILDQRELTKFTTKGGEEVDRLTIIVYFTDGTPGNYEDDNQYSYGNEVIDAAYQIKTDSQIPNAEIYSIGTFGFADSEPLVYEKYTGNNSEYKFDPDYVKTLPGTWTSGYMYRIWLRNTQGYGDVATDTVYDYMRTITTEFPNATQFVDPSWYGTGTKSDNSVYTDMVSRVRRDSNGNRRYFLCTDLSALNRVFTTIGSEEASASTTITLNDDNSYLFDELSSDFQKTDSSILTVETFKPTIQNDESISAWSLVQPADETVTAEWVDEYTAVKVNGFKYTEKYVAKANEANAEKIRLTITNVKTDKTNAKFASNTTDSGIFARENEDAEYKQEASFPVPETSRYKYTLKTTGDNTSPDITVKFKLTDTETGALVNGETYAGLAFNDGYATWTGATNNSEIIFEDLPENYKLDTVVVNNDTSGSYTYSLKVDDTDASFWTEQNENAADITGDDAVIDVNSIANNRNVTIINQTVKNSEQEEDYSDLTKKFPIQLTLTKDGSSEFASKTLTGTDQNGDPVSVTFTDGVATVDLADDESVTLSLPVGYSVKVEDATEPTAYSTTYEVDGTPITGTKAETDTNADRNIAVIHERNKETIATTGVDEDSASSSAILYTLAGILALSSGAYYIYARRKKVMQ